jgi:hypothetical protein
MQRAEECCAVAWTSLGLLYASFIGVSCSERLLLSIRPQGVRQVRWIRARAYDTVKEAAPAEASVFQSCLNTSMSFEHLVSALPIPQNCSTSTKPEALASVRHPPASGPSTRKLCKIHRDFSLCKVTTLCLPSISSSHPSACP